jgi:hypothetical protein
MVDHWLALLIQKKMSVEEHSDHFITLAQFMYDAKCLLSYWQIMFVIVLHFMKLLLTQALSYSESRTGIFSVQRGTK